MPIPNPLEMPLEATFNRLAITDGTQEEEASNDESQSITRLPETVFYKIFNYVTLEDVKNCRIACQRFNTTILDSKLLPERSVFLFDGRQDDINGLNVLTYFNETQNGTNKGCTIWNELWLRRGYLKQFSWISRQFTNTITKLVIKNCSFSWSSLLLMLAEFESLESFSDTLDLYFWDYTSFSEGLKDNNEELVENSHYKSLEPEILERLNKTLGNLKHVIIRRCQIADCVIYIKILLLGCHKLETLDITTDQTVTPQSPRNFTNFYNYIGQIIQANVSTLKTLWFPYKTTYPAVEFHVLDPNNPFNFFLDRITENNWAFAIQPTQLKELYIQFPSIQIDENEFLHKLLPFLSSWISSSSRTFHKLYLNCLYLEPGKEHIISDCIPSLEFNKEYGVWMIDTDGIPFIEHIQNYIKYINVQLWRPISTQLKHILMLEEDVEVDGDEFEPTLEQVRSNAKYNHVTQLQFFNKSVNFINFNMTLIIKNFINLTHLNLVEYNTRVDRIHSSESPATIEDEDLQRIFLYLKHLIFLQLIGNMTFVTDFGTTGLKIDACKRMVKRNVFETLPTDKVANSFASLKKLRTLVLRGVGIKVTDCTAYFGFIDMPQLRTIHIFGSHQVTRTAKTVLSQKYPLSRGCDVTI